MDTSSITIMYIPFPPSFSLFFYPLFLVPSLILLTCRSCDQAALAVAANTSITLKKDDPFNASIATGGVKADACASPNLAFNKALLLLHAGRVQTRGRDRGECKKNNRERRGNQKLNYDSRTKSSQLRNMRRRMAVRLRDWCC